MSETKQMCPTCSNITFSVIVYYNFDEKGYITSSGLKYECTRCEKVSEKLINMVIL